MTNTPFNRITAKLPPEERKRSIRALAKMMAVDFIKNLDPTDDVHGFLKTMAAIHAMLKTAEKEGFTDKETVLLIETFESSLRMRSVSLPSCSSRVPRRPARRGREGCSMSNNLSPVYVPCRGFDESAEYIRDTYGPTALADEALNAYQVLLSMLPSTRKVNSRRRVNRIRAFFRRPPLPDLESVESENWPGQPGVLAAYAVSLFRHLRSQEDAEVLRQAVLRRLSNWKSFDVESLESQLHYDVLQQMQALPEFCVTKTSLETQRKYLRHRYGDDG